jgi:hypothetical protein
VHALENTHTINMEIHNLDAQLTLVEARNVNDEIYNLELHEDT